MNAQALPSRPPFISLTIISAASLSHEVLLIHLFSIIQWQQFAYMVISLALLGFGASGTLLALFQHAMVKRFSGLYPVLLACFGISALAGFLLAQKLPFNPERLLWDPWQLGYLLFISVLLALPFLFAATAIGLVLMRYGGLIAKVYSFDLIGAGTGGLSLVLILWWVSPEQALILISMLGFAACVISIVELRAIRHAGSLVALALFVVTVVMILRGFNLEMSPYKGLSQTLRIQGARIIAEQSSPLGLISVLESPVTPLRHAPGLSITASTEPPPQLGLFLNGDAMTAITHYTGDLEPFEYLDQMTSALPYHTGNPEQVLILGAGGGAGVLQALRSGATRVDALELNSQIVDLVRNTYRVFSGSLFDDPRVHVQVDVFF